MNIAYQVNFDGIPGPYHNFGGLSSDNTASMSHKNQTSNPKAAALESLEKMKLLHTLGIRQAVLPPHERPHIPTLKALGFTGTDANILEKGAKEAPAIFRAVTSSSAMWTANAANTTPSIDSLDGRLHLTPANLVSKFHRSLEADTTYHILKAIFSNPLYFTIHPPLPRSPFFADEGSANHVRFCNQQGQPGVHLFVFGRYAFSPNSLESKKYPARQTFEAFEALGRTHQIDPLRHVIVQQTPTAIDAGVFHNDLIAMGNGNLFIYHEEAFVGEATVIHELKKRVREFCRTELITIKIATKEVSLQDAVESFFFNSQLIALPDRNYNLVCPTQCLKNQAVQHLIVELLEDAKNPITDIHYVNLNESMKNGGGPACLRLPVVMTKAQLEQANTHVFYTERLHENLTEWIKKHYRDQLNASDLVDPQLLKESREALDELTRILELGSIYEFQKNGTKAKSALDFGNSSR